jgi:hypothetical protein
LQSFAGWPSEEGIPSIVDCNDPVFLAPESMIREVQEFCRRYGLEVPKTPGQIAAVIYNSLADCYDRTVKELESITGSVYPVIHVVGGRLQCRVLKPTDGRPHKTDRLCRTGRSHCHRKSFGPDAGCGGI